MAFPGFVGFWGEAEKQVNTESAGRKAADEAAEASKISPRSPQNRGPRGSKWAPGGLPGVEKRSFEAKAVFEAILEAILTLRPPTPRGLQNRPIELQNER